MQSVRTRCYKARDDFFQCVDEKEPNFEACDQLKKNFESQCPPSWVHHFVLQRETREPAQPPGGLLGNS